MAALGIAFLILGLLASVAIHELGHLLPAKRFGVKVSQYFIGFGPTLWSTTRGGTEYGIKAIPLGGFVRIAGMLAPARPGTPVEKNGQITVAEEARQASATELGPGEEHQAFWRLTAPKKLAVMFGGPLTNLVLAALLIAGVVSGIGISQPTTAVGAIMPCVGQAEADQCEGKEPSPAALSGLEVGDVIVEWGRREVATWPELSAAIAQGGTGQVTVRVLRGGEPADVVITPVPVEQTKQNEVGEAEVREVPYAGIAPAFERQRQPFTRAADVTATIAAGTAKVVLTLPAQLWHMATNLVTGGERDQTGVVGIVGVADIAGNITSSNAVNYTAADRVADLTMLLAGLNMSLFVFNMIPLLPLDGGHILGAILEGTRRTIAKARGKADPGPFDTARLLPLSNAVFFALIAMTILLIVADIVNPVV
ncbi:M50 family metallopeptidase [Trueperella bernardiae]|uniref:M50 family metallopeptidase n=1 Tax=Trueperella bernardiae TaxID=59561 RepID=UPI00288B1AFB|nr:M50 family metallopeptidase [Trueperella bernardiae]